MNLRRAYIHMFISQIILMTDSSFICHCVYLYVIVCVCMSSCVCVCHLCVSLYVIVCVCMSLCICMSLYVSVCHHVHLYVICMSPGVSVCYCVSLYATVLCLYVTVCCMFLQLCLPTGAKKTQEHFKTQTAYNLSKPPVHGRIIKILQILGDPETCISAVQRSKHSSGLVRKQQHQSCRHIINT